MRTTFAIGDRVRIQKLVKPHGGKLGIVREQDSGIYGVWLDLMSNARLPHVKFYKAEELEPVTELYACEGCGFSEQRPAGTKQWHDCHPAKFPMTPLSIKTVVSRSMRLLRAKFKKGSR